ncbi:unnamed protein product [Callosobruchus maculatus]|uniref:Uncharacterized protein n=1 Tax=Callosobruchus maculatus TaxID=64391 RepID=A0A653BY89_CALMS|nr:unnamed protein product [Callosobruchus maculatus]
MDGIQKAHISSKAAANIEASRHFEQGEGFCLVCRSHTRNISLHVNRAANFRRIHESDSSSAVHCTKPYINSVLRKVRGRTNRGRYKSFKAMPAICHSDATSKLPRSHKNEVLASSNG